MASFGNGLALAWKGSGNDNLNVMVSDSDGASFLTSHKSSFGDSSGRGPALASSDSHLFMSWKGSGNEYLNVAELVPNALSGDTVIAYDLTNKVTVTETTEQAPGLAFTASSLALAWKGAGNDNLNASVSYDYNDFIDKGSFGDSSDRGPALTLHNGGLFLGWKGSGNDNLSFATLQP